MTSLTIELRDTTAQAVLEKAQLSGKTPEEWAAAILEQNAIPAGDKAWIEEFLKDAERVRGNSGGKKWTRDELYDR